jgi:hypothetical protein
MRISLYRGSKLKNLACHCREGHHHRSKLEASVCHLLHLRKRAGEFKEIKTEDKIYLSEARIKYSVDFRCLLPTGEMRWIEAKGHPNDTWAMKRKLWKAYGPGILEVWRGTHLKPYLHEIIQAKF